MADEQTINIPQLVFVLFLGVIAVRYFFFTGPTTRGDNASSSANNLRAREADVERIQQMFPQVPRRTIMWDLQRNGGNVVATTERILSGRGLETPPQTFQPPMPAPPAPVPGSTASASKTGKAEPPDLITRYNLAQKIAAASVEEAESDKASTPNGKQAWSQNKGERQALLQRRREEMILAARKKMEAKVAAESAGSATS